VREDMVYSSFFGCLALQKGPWKLEMCPGAGSPADRNMDSSRLEQFQLYRMDADVTERINLIQDNPEVFEQLRQQLISYIENGRSTPGEPQKNSGPEHDYWEEIAWVRNSQ
jgi:arylsulfatase A